MIPLLKLCELFVSLLIIGSVAVLPLYSYNIRKLAASELCVKIVVWIPIFSLFVAVLYSPDIGRLLATIVLIGMGLREARREISKSPRSVTVYYVMYSLAILHIWLASLLLGRSESTQLLLMVVFASALSDVGAFFCGKYLGRHHLPAAFNSRKSWEGVAGQFLGALLGAVLLRQFVGVALPIWIGLVVGLGSAVGDLSNSYVKRRLNIKDWGGAIPGHGGYLDRFSSLSIAVALSVYTYYFLA